MAKSTWIQSKRRKERYWLLFLLLMLIAVGAIILRNNPEIFSALVRRTESGPEESALGEMPLSQVTSSLQQSGAKPVENAPRVPPDRRKSTKELSRLTTRKSIMIPEINCTLLDRPDLQVMLSVELFFKNDSLKDEIMIKREELRVMVRKVLARKRLKEVLVDALRSEIKTEINMLLEHGSVVDIEFRDFRIETAEG